MYGLGLVKGLGLTLKHFVDSFTEDIKWLGSRYTTQTFAVRQGAEAKGVFTVEYPDEKIAVPERFRFVPFLVVNNADDPYAPGDDWCTSCGICAKVCPPQCIWIVRGTDPVTGRPKPQPEAFYIDIDICMNCGYCAEYCPFDAIKMDHDYELASYDRTTHHIYDKQRLSKEYRYWQTIAPNRTVAEAEARGHWEHKDVEKLAKKAGVTLPAPTPENRHRVTTVLVEDVEKQQAAIAPKATVALPAPAKAGVAAPAPVVTGDPAVIAANEGLPLNVRAAAALKLKTDTSRKLTPADRKVISAVQKLAKEAGTTIEALSEGGVDLSAVSMPVAEAAPVAAVAEAVVETPAPVAEATAAPVFAGDAQALIAQGKELERKGAAKEIKLTPADRKLIAQAKKAAKDAGIDW